MNQILRWTKFESIMIALFFIKGKSALKFNRFIRNQMSIKWNSY